MTGICITRIPVGVAIDVTQVVFLGEVIDKNLLQGGVGVGMLGKQQYPSCIAVETMGRM